MTNPGEPRVAATDTPYLLAAATSGILLAGAYWPEFVIPPRTLADGVILRITPLAIVALIYLAPRTDWSRRVLWNVLFLTVVPLAFITLWGWTARPVPLPGVSGRLAWPEIAWAVSTCVVLTIALWLGRHHGPFARRPRLPGDVAAR